MQKETENKRSKFQTGNVLTISFAHLLHDVYSSFLAPLLPLLIERFGLSYTASGMLSVIQRIPNSFSFLIGLIAEKLAARYFLIFAPALTALCMSLLGIAPGYIVLAILIFVSGISSTLFHVPAPAMIRKISGNKTGLGMSLYMAAGESARTIGPIAITFVVAHWGLEGTYKLMPVGIIASIILYFRFKDIPISRDIKKKERGSFRILFENTNFFLIIAAILFCRGLLKSSLTFYLPTYLIHYSGEDLSFSNYMLAVLQLAGVVGALFAGTISDKLGRTKTLKVIFFITPILMIPFMIASKAYLVPILLLLGFFSIAPTSVFLALVQDIGHEKPAFMNSIFTTISFVIGATTVPIFGLISDIWGMNNAFIVSSIVAFLAFPLTFVLSRISKK
jgi:FSR family fosmidomycin resistance protein-like MFS transporter